MNDFHITFNFIGGSLGTLIIIGYIIMEMHDYLFWFLIKSHYIFICVYHIPYYQTMEAILDFRWDDMHVWLIFMWVSLNQLQTKQK